MPRAASFQRAAWTGKVPLAAKIEFLKRPEAYPGRVSGVRAVETHMSWVFLTEAHAYKLKKPVRTPFLDFRSLAARRRFSYAELRLNRRLAPAIYLAVVPLKIGPEGRLRLGGEGRTVDWLVKMRRLPQTLPLDHRLRDRRLGETDVARLARLLADFYRSAKPVPMSSTAYRRRFEVNIRTNRRELSRREWKLPAKLVRSVTAAQLAFLEQHPSLFDERTHAKRIVEAHGDLRPEHIYLGPKPLVLDCLEFNRSFRIADPADEMSFLALECERLRSRQVGAQLEQRYRRLTGDRVPERLLQFYKSERACLRAKIAILHLREPGVRRAAKWRRRAVQYLNLAHKFVRAFSREPTTSKAAGRPRAD
jgi:aminoglycoside phosphotransferase family enzyme